MTDVTNNWVGKEKSRDIGADPLGGEATDAAAQEAATSLREPKSFQSDGASDALETGEPEPLLRATLETIRVKADELKTQTREWSRLRQDQARDMIDERPITAVAAAFGIGIFLGALLSR